MEVAFMLWNMLQERERLGLSVRVVNRQGWARNKESSPDKEGGNVNKAKKSTTPDPLRPSLALLVRLGSIAVHAEEMLSPTGHGFDRVVLEQLLRDAEVVDWIKAMGVYMPLKRGGVGK